MKYTTEILKIKGDWQEVVDDCRTSVGKESLGKEPSTLFKRRILIAEHSPIRNIVVRWMWKHIYSFVATHWSRHKWEVVIKTQRGDRVGHDTSKNTRHEPVDCVATANAQHLIDTFRKRLCCQASDETRDSAEEFKEKLRLHERELSDVLVPNCVYRCACPEMEACPRNVWPTFLAWCRVKHSVDPRKLSIEGRYRLYNEWFYGEWRTGRNGE